MTMAGADQIPDREMEFDANALRERYRQERDKRLRPEGSAQYIETTRQFSRYFEVDPYVEPGFTREPLTDEVEVAIIGAASAVYSLARDCAKQASTTSASSRLVATS